MTVIPITDADVAGKPSVVIAGGELWIHDLVLFGEAADLAQAFVAAEGPAGLVDLIRKAVPIGLTALAMSNAGMATGAIQRTLDDFAVQVDVRSQAALTRLDETSTRLVAGEQAIASAAQQLLAQLPARLDAVLGGEAGHVRAAVGEATRAVQAAGMLEMQAALALHSESVRAALSLDDGPIQGLRRDLLAQADSHRREIGEQLTVLRGMMHAADGHKAGAAKSTRAQGLEFEAYAIGVVAAEVVTAAGDRLEATGSRAAPGTTARTGDGVATLSSAISGHGRELRIAIEAKRRTSRPISARGFKDELATARVVRHAAGALAIVASKAEVPGGGRFCRVDDLSFVVAIDDDDEAVRLVYLVLRELVAYSQTSRTGEADVDLSRVEGYINQALGALSEFDEIGRLGGEAQKNVTRLLAIGEKAKERILQALTAGTAALRL